MRGDRHLVEQTGLDPLGLAAVILTPALLEPLEHLALARSLEQRAAARVDFGVAAVELELGRLAEPRRPLDVGLAGEQVLPAHLERGGLPARVLRAAVVLARRAQHRLALEAHRQRRGQVLAGLVLEPLAERANTLQPEVEGATGHGRVNRPRPGRLDRDWTVVRAGPARRRTRRR